MSRTMRRLMALLGGTVIALVAAVILAAQAAAQPITVGGGGGENDIRGPQRVVANISPWSRPTWCIPGANDPFDQAACKWWYWKTWGQDQTIKLIAEQRNGRDWKAVARLNGLPDDNPNLTINGFIALQAEGLAEVRRLQGRLLGETTTTNVVTTGGQCATFAQAVEATRVKAGMGRHINDFFAKNAPHVKWGLSGKVSFPQRTAIYRLNGQSVNWKLPQIAGLQAIHGPEKNDEPNFYFIGLQDQIDLGRLRFDVLPFCGGAFNPEANWPWWLNGGQDPK